MAFIMKNLLPQRGRWFLRLMPTLALIIFFAGAWSVSAYAEDILIGQVSAFTGPLAPTGTDIGRGLLVAFEVANQKGGIKGRKLSLIQADDGYKSEQTVVKANEMLVQNRDLVAFTGFLGTGNVEALIKSKLLSAQEISLVGVRTGGAREFHPLVFHLRASYRDEVGEIIRHAAILGLDQVAVFYQEDSFGKTGLQAAQDFSKQYNVRIVAHAGYEKNTTQVIPAAEALAKVDAKVVVMISNTAASAEFVKEYRKRGGTANLMIISVTDGEQLFQKVGNELARGIAISQVVPNPYKRTLPIVREFQEAVAKSKIEGIKANYTTMEGYLMGKVLIHALERSPRISRAVLAHTLESMGRVNMGDFVVEFGPKKHEGSGYVELSVIGNGGKLLQ